MTPKSEAAGAQTAATERFYADLDAIDKVAGTVKLSEVSQADFDGVFYPGGHGPIWDLATDKNSVALIEDFYRNNKPIAFVCHAPAALLHAQASNGEPLVKGKNITGFSDTEEAAVKLTGVVPFLLEDELKKLGAHYSKAADWGNYTQQDGHLITGQNPASSESVARLLLSAIMEKSNLLK